MEDRGHLTTEQRHPRSRKLDTLAISEAFDLINGEDATIAAAVAEVRDDICRAIEIIVESFRIGGRLIYVGAGTSGRLGVLDAAECPPTFLTDPAMVLGIIAGGSEALTLGVEGVEDDPDQGASAMDGAQVGPRDTVFGIATGGTTPFVHGALRRARELGAATVFFACVPEQEVADDADVSIRVVTGPEVLTGSTRLRAGTATKMVLNAVSTISMVRIGKVFENLMVDVNTAANAKLVDRGTRTIGMVTGESREVCRSLLDRAGGRVKTALVMHARDVGRDKAERLLQAADGHVAEVLSGPPQAKR